MDETPGELPRAYDVPPDAPAPCIARSEACQVINEERSSGLKVRPIGGIHHPSVASDPGSRIHRASFISLARSLIPGHIN